MANISFDVVDLNVNGRNKKVQDEFDIIMYNGNTIATIEVKQKVHPEDIQKLKTKKLENFKYLFPHYASCNYILGLGGFSLPKDIVELADKEGIAVFQKRGETTLKKKKLASFLSFICHSFEHYFQFIFNL